MKKIFVTGLALLGIMATSCDDYLDINQDPNSPTENNMTSSMILPTAEMNIAATYGDFMRNVGGYYVQHYSQYFGTSNYLDYSQFKMSATRSSSSYTQLTSCALNNLKTVRSLAEAEGDWGTYLAATTLRAFTYQVLVDCYGEVPYTEALSLDHLTPKFDEGQDIYDGIIAELDEALAKASAGDQVATSFLYAGKSADAWIKFANALKLRIYTRESGVKNVDDKIAALIKEDNFPTSDVAFKGIWSDAVGKANPFYQEDAFTSYGGSQQNIVLNLALYQAMSDYDDGRLEAFFNPNGSGAYTGAVSGTNFSTTSTYKANYWCRPNAHFDDPVDLISVAEVYFMKAEYYAKANKMTDAQENYEKAVKSSFIQAYTVLGGMDAASAAAKADTDAAKAIAAYPLTAANYKQALGVQKWIALAGSNNFEAWCEVRRLGYPQVGSVTGAQIYSQANDTYKPELLKAGELYTPIDCNTSLSGKVLQRWPYAEASANRNSNAPKYPGDATPVFWAK